MAIPSRRRTATPCLDHGPLELPAANPLQRAVGPELAPQPAEGLGVRAAARWLKVGLDEKQVGRFTQRRRALPRGAQPPARASAGAHRRECVALTARRGDASLDGS
ncbi:MAG: hypothetical protein ACXVHQ_39335 [Solirubrobacteraceae bacterium]